jgi:hypothetical protein
MPDLKPAEKALDTVGGLGRIYRDQAGPAVYRLEPTPATAVACQSCLTVGLVPSIPRKPILVYRCSGCGAKIRLEPPPIVWLEGSRPGLIL